MGHSSCPLVVSTLYRSSLPNRLFTLPPRSVLPVRRDPSLTPVSDLPLVRPDLSLPGDVSSFSSSPAPVRFPVVLQVSSPSLTPVVSSPTGRQEPLFPLRTRGPPETPVGTGGPTVRTFSLLLGISVSLLRLRPQTGPLPTRPALRPLRYFPYGSPPSSDPSSPSLPLETYPVYVKFLPAVVG